MLVLSRKVGQMIVIGNARVIVMESGPGRVSLGIDAPADIRVLRGELAERLADEFGDTPPAEGAA